MAEEMIKNFEGTDIAKCSKIIQCVCNNEMQQCNWNDATAYAYLQDFAQYQKFAGFTQVVDDEVTGAILKCGGTTANYMFVLAQSQRLGYGQQLIKAAEAYVCERQLAGIPLSTN